MPQNHVLGPICFAWEPINFSSFITFEEFTCVETASALWLSTNVYKLFISYN